MGIAKEHFLHQYRNHLRLLAFGTSFALSLTSFDKALSRDKQANPQVGKTAGVINFVIGDNLDKLRQLKVDDPVYALERISAELESHGEILLDDDSRIVVGPGAEISLDDFVVADNGIQSGTLNILKGAFRFISGNSPKGTFKVVTPLSTIGIRGTLFDVYVNDKGQTDVIIYSGSVNVCTLNNRCKILHKTCDVVRVKSKNNIRFAKFLRSGNMEIENKRYNLVENQDRFSKEWRAPIDKCDVRGSKPAKGLFNNNYNTESDPDPGESGGAPGANGPSGTTGPGGT